MKMLNTYINLHSGVFHVATAPVLDQLYVLHKAPSHTQLRPFQRPVLLVSADVSCLLPAMSSRWPNVQQCTALS